MKRFLPTFVMLLSFLSVSSQTVTLSFTGRDDNNHFIPLNRVVITDITQSWRDTILYPDTIYVMNTVGIEEYDDVSFFSLSQNVPNPFDGISDFSLLMPKSGKVSIEIIDLNGRKITSYSNELQAGRHTLRVQLANRQGYVLTARCGKDKSSIKMMNTGNAGLDCILYVGEGTSHLLTSQLKDGKGESNHPFQVGDDMEYIGYVVIDSAEYQSQTIQQQQVLSENFILNFQVQGEDTTPELAVVTTDSVTNIGSDEATCGGNVTADGNDTVTARGVCWSTSPNPTLGDSYTTDGMGMGSFTSNLTGLMPGTTYYVRAYATNSEGTAYGNQKSFITLVTIPTLMTNDVGNVTGDWAFGGGTVITDGGTPVTARGVCWSTLQNPTINDRLTTNGSGVGDFFSNITGLTPDTTYYVRAYATNSEGTAYGNEVSFISTNPYETQPCSGATIIDYDSNTYNTVQIGTQCWMKENLKTTHYANGDSILHGSGNSTTTAYWYYPNNNSDNKSTYGLLYNWKAAMGSSSGSSASPSGVQGICPTGWHVPSDAEWTALTNFVRSQSQYCCSSNASYIAKALASSVGWNSYLYFGAECVPGKYFENNDATGFSAVPAGNYYYTFNSLGYVAYFWSTTEYNSICAYRRTIEYSNTGVYRHQSEKEFGHTVRCLRD